MLQADHIFQLIFSTVATGNAIILHISMFVSHATALYQV